VRRDAQQAARGAQQLASQASRSQLDGVSVVASGAADGVLTEEAEVAEPKRLTAFAMRLATEPLPFAVRARRAGRGLGWLLAAALNSAAAPLASAIGASAALALDERAAAVPLAAGFALDDVVAGSVLGELDDEAAVAVALRRLAGLAPAGCLATAACLATAVCLATALVFAAVLGLAAAAGLAALDVLVTAIALAADFRWGVATDLAAAVVAFAEALGWVRPERGLGAAAVAARLRCDRTIAHSASLRLAGLAPWASATLAAFSMSAIRLFQEVAKRLSDWDLAPLSTRVSITPAAETFLRRRLKISF